MGVKVVQALLANTQPNHVANVHLYGSSRAHSKSSHVLMGKPCVGPILLVTQTNHALDQFMEGLLKAGISKMIRVGGQSKSEVLKPYNLNDMWKGARSKQERQAAGRLHEYAASLLPVHLICRCMLIAVIAGVAHDSCRCHKSISVITACSSQR